MKGLVFLVVAFLWTAPLWAATTVRVPLRKPAEISVAHARKVVVVEFEGVDQRMNLNTQIASYIRKALVK